MRGLDEGFVSSLVMKPAIRGQTALGRWLGSLAIALVAMTAGALVARGLLAPALLTSLCLPAMFTWAASSHVRGRLRLMAPPIPVALLFTLQYFLPGLVLLGGARWIYPHTGSNESVVVFPWIATLVGWVAFLIGYSWPTAGRPEPESGSPAGSYRRMRTIGRTCAAVAVGAILLSWQLSGGLTATIAKGSTLEGSGVLNILAYLSLPSMLLLAQGGRRDRILAVVVGAVASVFFVSVQARGNAWELLAITSVALWVYRPGRWKRLLLPMVVLAAFLIFLPFAQALPRLDLARPGVLTVSLGNYARQYPQNLGDRLGRVLMADVSKIEQLSLVLDYVPDRFEHRPASILGVAAGPVLKRVRGEAVLPWDRELTAVVYGFRGPVAFSMGSSGLAELYVFGGWLALSIGMVVYGLVSQRLWAWFMIAGSRTPSGRALYVAYLSLILLSLQKGFAVVAFAYLYLLWPLPLLIAGRTAR
jgi:hypothetical protein